MPRRVGADIRWGTGLNSGPELLTPKDGGNDPNSQFLAAYS